MWTFLSKSIVRRFNAVILTVITLSLISFTLFIAMYNYNRTINDLEETAKGTIELASISLEAPIWYVDEPALKDILRAIMLDKNIAAIRVTEKKGADFADNRKYLDIEDKRKHLKNMKFEDLINRNEFLYNKAAVLWEDETIGFVHILTSKTKAYDLKGHFGLDYNLCTGTASFYGAGGLAYGNQSYQSSNYPVKGECRWSGPGNA